MTLPEFEVRGLLRALEVDAQVQGADGTPWREWVDGLPERKALGYTAILATEFRSTPEQRPGLTGNGLLMRHLNWVRDRLMKWFQEAPQTWLAYLAACACVSPDDGGPWYWTATHQRIWGEGDPVRCPAAIKAMTLLGSSRDDLVRNILTPAAIELFNDLSSVSPSSRLVRQVVALAQFLAGRLERSEVDILGDAHSAFDRLRSRLKLEPGDPRRAVECLRELKTHLPEELWLKNLVSLQLLHRALQMWPASKKPQESVSTDGWSVRPAFEEAFINNWD